MAEPRTEAGKRLWRRGSNNWSGEGWIATFAANIAAVEIEAAEGGLLALLDVEQEVLRTWPSREELAAMTTDEVNAWLASIGLSIRVVDKPVTASTATQPEPSRTD